MARKKDQLKVALVLDLDDFSSGLKKSRAQGQAEGNAINAALGDVADKVAARFFSVQAAMALAKKAYREFVDKALELEKAGKGNEGTAAIARISAAVDRMWTSFVRSVTETKLARSALDGLASVAEVGAVAMNSWSGALSVARGGVKELGASILDLLTSTSDATNNYAGAIRGALAAIPIIGPSLAATTAASTGLNIGSGGATNAAISGKAEGLRDAASGDVARVRSEIERMRAESAKISGADRTAAFGRASGSVVDTFVGSWTAGFARLSDLFKGFSDEVSKSLGFMSASTVQALGDTFDSVAFLGPMLQRVYGQSTEGAKRFQAAQLALAGALAVVKGAESFADGLASGAKGDAAGALGHFAASGAYAAAATLAGVSANRALSGGGGGRGVGISSPETFRQERRSVTVIIDQAVGGEEFVRREVIPAINAAVKADVVVLSSAAQSASTVQPGRYGV